MTKRMSITLTDESVEQLTYLCSLSGSSLKECIRQSIATEAYFRKQLATGAKVLIENTDDTVCEVVFR